MKVKRTMETTCRVTARGRGESGMGTYVVQDGVENVMTGVARRSAVFTQSGCAVIPGQRWIDRHHPARRLLPVRRERSRMALLGSGLGREDSGFRASRRSSRSASEKSAPGAVEASQSWGRMSTSLDDSLDFLPVACRFCGRTAHIFPANNRGRFAGLPAHRDRENQRRAPSLWERASPRRARSDPSF